MASPPVSANGRLSAKEAAQRAQAFLRDLLGEVSNIRLEEVELSGDERHWLITLSFIGQGVDRPHPLTFLGITPAYKQFEVDAQTGEVRAMRIPQV